MEQSDPKKRKVEKENVNLFSMIPLETLCTILNHVCSKRGLNQVKIFRLVSKCCAKNSLCWLSKNCFAKVTLLANKWDGLSWFKNVKFSSLNLMVDSKTKSLSFLGDISQIHHLKIEFSDENQLWSNQSIISSFGHIRSLEIIKPCITAIPNHLTNLTKLVSYSGIKHSHLTSLRSLHIKHNEKGFPCDQKADHWNLTNLRELEYENIDIVELYTFLKTLTNLERLKIKHIIGFDDAFDTDGFNQHPNLEKVSLECADRYNLGWLFDILSQSPKLRTLGIGIQIDAGIDKKYFASGFKGLTHLDIRVCGLYMDFEYYDEFWNQITKLENLEEFCLQEKFYGWVDGYPLSEFNENSTDNWTTFVKMPSLKTARWKTNAFDKRFNKSPVSILKRLQSSFTPS